MRIIKLSVLTILFSLIGVTGFGQYNFQAVFPGLSGSQLESAVEDAYRPLSSLDYGMARDTMFRNVYSVDNTLSCVYTGHTLPMPAGADPTEIVYMNGAPGGINTEHSWPRSYGAEFGNPKSDMHHLYPTRVDVNGERGTLPFLDIPDNQTDEWYYLGNQQGNIPGANIDLWSERNGSAFEPREDHKGNVARAMMYFKAIYPQQAQQAPADFWTNMAPTLCDWHGQDPVDSLEWHRSMIIAKYQNDRPNPFVLDCTLAQRIFCPGFSGTCDPTVPIREVITALPVNIFPNPASEYIQLNPGPQFDGKMVSISIYNSIGQVVHREEFQQFSTARLISFSPPMTPGWYSVQLRSADKIGVGRFIIQ